jgi:hypothetical protein
MYKNSLIFQKVGIYIITSFPKSFLIKISVSWKLNFPLMIWKLINFEQQNLVSNRLTQRYSLVSWTIGSTIWMIKYLTNILQLIFKSFFHLIYFLIKFDKLKKTNEMNGLNIIMKIWKIWREVWIYLINKWWKHNLVKAFIP